MKSKTYSLALLIAWPLSLLTPLSAIAEEPQNLEICDPFDDSSEKKSNCTSLITTYCYPSDGSSNLGVITFVTDEGADEPAKITLGKDEMDHDTTFKSFALMRLREKESSTTSYALKFDISFSQQIQFDVFPDENNLEEKDLISNYVCTEDSNPLTQ